MARTFLNNAALATLAAGVLLLLAALVPTVGTNKNASAQLLAGLLLTHAAVLPLAAANRFD